MFDTDQLTEPEKALWQAFPRGEWVNLPRLDSGDNSEPTATSVQKALVTGGGAGAAEDGDRRRANDASNPEQTAGTNDPPPAGTAAPDIRVRAEVIAALLLGVREPEPGYVPAIKLSGALVTGRLDLGGASIAAPIRLNRCRFEEMPSCREAHAPRVRLTDCTLPGFEGTGLRTESYLSLSGSVVEGPIVLPRGHLTGGLRLNGTRIHYPDGYALMAGALTVENGTLARDLRVRGGVRLTGARMGGGLFLEGARLDNPDGEAMTADNMTVEDAMECSHGFTANGRLRLRGARINGTLSFDQGALSSPTQALHGSHMRVEELIFTPRRQVEGEVNLGYTHVGVLLDHFQAWPARVRLNGLTYDSLRGPHTRLRDRLDWVSRHPEGYRPQPYGQLAEWYRRIGHDDDARRVLLAKQRHRRSTLGPVGRLVGYVLDGTVGYGYRPVLAAAWFALLVTVGTAAFAISPPIHVGDGTPPPFNSFVYTLDLLIPFGAFGLRAAYAATGAVQWLDYGLVVAGWLLATALITAATRVLRRT